MAMGDPGKEGRGCLVPGGVQRIHLPPELGRERPEIDQRPAIDLLRMSELVIARPPEEIQLPRVQPGVQLESSPLVAIGDLLENQHTEIAGVLGPLRTELLPALGKDLRHPMVIADLTGSCILVDPSVNPLPVPAGDQPTLI